MRIEASVKQYFEPTVGAKEVDHFFRELRQTIVDLENAYQRGRLDTCLAMADVERRFGTLLYNSYMRLTQYPAIADIQGRRIETVYALLDQARDQLFHVDVWFHADLEPAVRDGIEAIQSILSRQDIRYRVAQGLERPVLLRLDQIVEARKWGIGLVLNDESETDRLVQINVAHSLHSLSQDLSDLSRILTRVLRAETGRFPRIVAPHSGRVLEQLVVDILNEDSKIAHLASLCEDYSQKTDVRVWYPELRRKRGARLQVTWSASSSGHQWKVDSIERADHYAIFSPWALANSVPQLGNCQREEKASFDSDLISRLWSCLDRQPSDTAMLAGEFRSILDNAVKSTVCDPRGPMALVPTPLREYIREWVHFEAVRSTNALRQWQADGGTFERRWDGRLMARHGRARIPMPTQIR